MKNKCNKLMLTLLGFMLAAMPFASAQAENPFDLYAFQSWTYEWVNYDGQEDDDGNIFPDRDYDRLSNDAANIGFRTHVNTSIPGLQVGFQCEQYTFWSTFSEYASWCNRNSKISLRHDTMGEIMFATWLLPYNEIVAQWIDPFYGSGADGHHALTGNIGGAAGFARGNDAPGGVGNPANVRAGGWLSSTFYLASFTRQFSNAFGALSFDRLQEGIVQYVWPNTDKMSAHSGYEGFQFRFAITSGDMIERVGVDQAGYQGGATLDPRVMSMGVSYQQNMGADRLWLAAAYEQHEDISAANMGFQCDNSDDEGMRLAGSYKKDWGNGMTTLVAAMYEQLEYEATCNFAGIADDRIPVWSGVERDMWYISGKHTFGNNFDFRFSYSNADDWDCDEGVCDAAAENGTGADAMQLGLVYTISGQNDVFTLTELRATYSQINNDDQGGYDFGIGVGNAGRGMAAGQDISQFAVGIVQLFGPYYK